VEPSSQPAAQLIADAIWQQKFRFSNEWELQRGIATVLTGLGLEFKAEVKLGAKDRIDFLVVSQKVGIEVKVDGSLAAVTRQLWRYADHPDISCFILVTTRSAHQRLPMEMKGKPILVVYLLNSLL
jgi:hypothetical protein